MAFASSSSSEECGMRRFRTEVVVGVAPTERMSLCPADAECTVSATTRRASNSCRR